MGVCEVESELSKFGDVNGINTFLGLKFEKI